MQSVYLRIIFHLKHKKSPFLAVLTWFLILGKVQDGAQDADHCWWRHRPPSSATTHKIYLILLRWSKAFQWRQNRFEILQRIKNSGKGQWRIQGRGQAPPPLYFSTEMRPKGPKKNFLETGPPVILGSGWPAPPYLKGTWIRHWGFPSTLLLYRGGGYDFACTSES